MKSLKTKIPFITGGQHLCFVFSDQTQTKGYFFRFYVLLILFEHACCVCVCVFFV